MNLLSANKRQMAVSRLPNSSHLRPDRAAAAEAAMCVRPFL